MDVKRKPLNGFLDCTLRAPAWRPVVLNRSRCSA